MMRCRGWRRDVRSVRVFTVWREKVAAVRAYRNGVKV